MLPKKKLEYKLSYYRIEFLPSSNTVVFSWRIALPYSCPKAEVDQKRKHAGMKVALRSAPQPK